MQPNGASARPLDSKPRLDSTPVPLVSVVILTSDHARFLADAIASARAQGPDAVDVIVVDDGSSDDPAAVAGRFPGVRTIRQANQGLASARNTGWRAARGRYVVFLDADDRLRPGAVAAHLERFALDPERAFVCGGRQLVDEEGRPLGRPVANDLGPDAYVGLLRGDAVAMKATVMYRRDRLEEAGGFDARLRACEDYDLMLRLARTDRVGFGPDIVAEHTRHPGDMSNDLGLMLTSALLVLRRHRADVAGRPDLQRAMAEGERRWRSHYAREALGRLEQALRARRGIAAAARGAARMAGLAPAAVVRVAAVEAWARVVRRLRSRPAAVDLGDLRRLTPRPRTSAGSVPIDGRYADDFLERHAADVCGRRLEIAGDGGDPEALGALSGETALPADAFDCIVLRQALGRVFDLRRAVEIVHRALKPGGVLLATVPGVSARADGGGGDRSYWALTATALERLLSERFGPDAVAVSSRGNVLAATAHLHGLDDRELTDAERERRDPDYPILVVARAVKAAATEKTSDPRPGEA
jgi:SAM-dependent methyltransferase